MKYSFKKNIIQIQTYLTISFIYKPQTIIVSLQLGLSTGWAGSVLDPTRTRPAGV